MLLLMQNLYGFNQSQWTGLLAACKASVQALLQENGPTIVQKYRHGIKILSINNTVYCCFMISVLKGSYYF